MREIITNSSLTQMNLASSAPSADGYSAKLTKLIPGEIVTGYLFIKGSYEAVLKIATDDPALSESTVKTVMYVAIIALTVLAPVIYKRAFEVKNNKQLTITVIAFLCWVFSIGGPFDTFFHSEFKSFLSGLLVLFFTLVAPLFFKK
ncbi:hypothetical protein [Ekhidna sp. To15]|uniref:hypothetical protein n=1 Tax=Ekhidna sp. To15 TaxID=3395267 RepID=UPI003F52120B